LQQILDERQASLLAIILPDSFHRAKFQHGPAARFRRGHAGTKILRRKQSEMLLHLFPQPLIVSPSCGEVRQPRQKPP
jgi:hypothetical protein